MYLCRRTNITTLQQCVYVSCLLGLLAVILSPTSVMAGVFDNIPEATNDGYVLLYDLDIPDTSQIELSTPNYTVDNSHSFLSGDYYDRVGYYLELENGGQTQYAWASMDAFTKTPYKLGLPTHRSGASLQQNVSNMNVVSNVPGVVNGTGISTGNIEFWPHNYATANAAEVPGASDGKFDFGDTIKVVGDVSYGSMQIHNHGASQTVMAYNRWGYGGMSDLGIGNNPNAAGNPDWTFTQNASQYTVKRMQVLVRPTDPAPQYNIFTDVPESSDYEILYAANIQGSANHNADGINYTIDNSSTVDDRFIDRVAYYMELQTPGGERQWAYASMDAFSNDSNKLGVPFAATGAFFQQNVSNMNVFSNKSGIVQGTALETGNIEFWAGNYGRTNVAGVPGADNDLYDTGDQFSTSKPIGYGSMQIHNHADGANQTVMAYNAWGNNNDNNIGIGNNPAAGSHPDWTFTYNGDQYEIANMFVMVKEGVINLSKPSGQQIVQRDNQNQADVKVEGVFKTETQITSIQARAVAREGFSGTSSDWVTIDDAPSDGAFSSALTLGGGWYDIEVRAMDGETVVGDDTIQRVGVGEVFVTAGQSNSANSGETQLQAQDERVLAFDGTNWRRANDPQPIATASGGSPWPSLGDKLAAEFDVPIGFVSVGWGGTRVGQWVPGAAGRDSQPLYERLKAGLQAMGPKGSRAVLWHQGESDASNNTSSAEYKALLEEILAASRSEELGAGFEVPWLIALASYRPNTGPDPDVIAGQQMVIDADPRAFLGAQTDSLLGSLRSADGIHFSATGLEAHAEQWFNALVASGVIVVPEPGMMTLLSLLLLSVLVTRRKRPS